MEKQTIQFNGQEWEEITLEEYKKTEDSLCAYFHALKERDAHYYRLIPPPETFPKIFGRYEVQEDGGIYFAQHSEYREQHSWITFKEDEDIPNLKLALAESERVRSKQ